MEVVILIGIQASGKSTFCKTHFADTHIRINLDMLKTRHREKILVNACIEGKQSFVVDNTNPVVNDRKRYFDYLKDSKFLIKGYYFSSKIEEALKRNALREIPISEIAIRSCYSKLELPNYSEGFDELYYVELIDNSFNISGWKNEI